MRVVHAGGLAGARTARGSVVVIDVIRAFTVSAYALAGGATGCWPVASLDDARTLAAKLGGAAISAEKGGLPVAGIELGNSPTAVVQAGPALRGRPLVQRTSLGTQAIVAAAGAERLFAASLVVAAATARAVRAGAPGLVTLVATGQDDGHPEDRACAECIEAHLHDQRVDLELLLRPLLASERYRQLRSGTWPGQPAADLDLALDADRFDFAMPAERGPMGIRLVRG
jgi:2-phosphosulfolactate phosphatase